jgi:myo-inositol-1(or 4)-monophosphatase
VTGSGREPGDRREQAPAAELLDVAVAAACAAGALLAERFAAGRERAVASKSTPTDLVSEADLSSERAIREMLAQRRPHDGFLGEEGGDVLGTSGLRWVVDPLDGTINFLFGIPQWCVSVAVEDDRGSLAGAVYDPGREELFTATRGKPPHCNGEVISASGRTEAATAMVATGFAYDAAVRHAQARVLERVVAEVRDVRRFGSAALDLAWTAAGRYDAYYERTVQPWDIAAGTLLCESAGLAVAELPVHPDLPWGILVADPGLMDALLPVVGASAS